MTNLISIVNHLQRKTQEVNRKHSLNTFAAKRAYERQKLIDYYDTLNQGKVSIPSFMLADMVLERKYRT